MPGDTEKSPLRFPMTKPHHLSVTPFKDKTPYYPDHMVFKAHFRSLTVTLILTRPYSISHSPGLFGDR